MERNTDDADVAPAERTPRRARLEGARILVVEDEVVIAMEIESNLQDAGAEIVGPAYTLSEAVLLAAEARISAAVLDLRLGKESVGPVAQALSARKIPFLFYSGQSASDPVRAQWPDTAVISKPVSPGVLVAALEMLLAARAGGAGGAAH